MSDHVKLSVSILLFNCFLSGMCAALAASAETQSAAMKRSWVDLPRYSGKAGSVQVSQADFRQLAFELQAHRATLVSKSVSSVSPQKRQPYESLKVPRNNLRNRVPLSVIHWNREVGNVTSKQQRQAFATGTAPIPVSTNMPVFAFSPVRPTTYRGANIVLTLDPSDVFEETTDTNKAIVSLRVDAGDGSGWRDLSAEQEVTASYATTGAKAIALEATLADGSVLNASAPLEVAALATPDPTETVELDGGQLYIYKSGNHAGLRCPVFVVEGFDMNNDMGWDELYDILNKEQMAETLKAYGRDLVVLDFTDAMADIMNVNAVVAIDAINYINSVRSNLADKFTVIGASMGGLVSRNALARMDKHPDIYGQSHVNTWVSFDSPQEGANIPLGVQEFFNFFGSYAGDYSDLAMALEYRSKVDSPAAQQMLLCHYKANTALAGRSPAYASFDSDMRSAGYPSSCKKIAITNGSKFGLKQPFAPGELAVYWYYNSFEVALSAKIYALGKSATTATTAFYGWFDPWDWWDNIDDTVYKSRYYPYALDNAAGGTRASFQELFDNLPSSMKDSDDHCYYARHCFIPTTSAVGIPKEYLEKSISDNPSVAALSPFDEFHCAASNEPHIDINRTNKEWFMKAILENYDSDGDGADDYQEYVLGTDYSSTNKVEFTQTAVTASGEGDTGSGTYQAVASVFGIGPVSVNVFVMSGSASTLDYVASAAPFTVTWAAGEAGPKNITIPIKGDRLVEGPEVFYLVLGSTFSDRIGEANVCTVTIPDDDLGAAPVKGVFVTGLPQSPVGGKVYGAAYCLPGKAVTLSAFANSGWTFLRWEDGSQAPSRTVSYDVAAAGAQSGVMLGTAFFAKTSALTLPVLTNPGLQSAMIGLPFRLPLTVTSVCLPKITVSGLPVGLTFDAKTVSVIGVPARAGIFNVAIAASNPKGTSLPQKFTMTVEPLPVWAQGSFSGFVETDDLGSGNASMSVTSVGGVTGKLMLRGTNFSFSAKSYASLDASGAFLLVTTAKVDRVSLPLTLGVNVPDTVKSEGIVPATLSKAEGMIGDTGLITLYRSVWKEAGMTAVATNFTGYYTAALSRSEDCGSGYLTFTVDKAGNVKTTGKLADGTVVSLSGSLVMDTDGRVFAVLCTAPAAYKGGSLFGLAEWVKGNAGVRTTIRLMDGMGLCWVSFNPQATRDYGWGFERSPDLTGGWYDTMGNLYEYYRGKTLTVVSNGSDSIPELQVGANRYQSVCWSSDWAELGVVTNRLGVMTGLSAPKVGAPVKLGDGSYEYPSGINTVGLTISLTRATGIFKGSFKVWFDYAATHTQRSVTYEGVLTPEREDKEDGVEGRGFFLWADKGQYTTPLNRIVPYTFNWSYDLLLLSQPQP